MATNAGVGDDLHLLNVQGFSNRLSPVFPLAIVSTLSKPCSVSIIDRQRRQSSLPTPLIFKKIIPPFFGAVFLRSTEPGIWRDRRIGRPPVAAKIHRLILAGIIGFRFVTIVVTSGAEMPALTAAP